MVVAALTHLQTVEQITKISRTLKLSAREQTALMFPVVSDKQLIRAAYNRARRLHVQQSRWRIRQPRRDGLSADRLAFRFVGADGMATGLACGVVERIWHFDGSVAHAHERIFPNGVVELIVHLDHRYKLITNGRAEPCARACIGGLYTGAFVIEAPKGLCRVVGIRFRPAAAFTVLGMPMSELTNITADLCDVVGPAARELADRCSSANSAEACVRLAARWVESQLAVGRETDRRLHGSPATRAGAWSPRGRAA